MPKSKPSEVEVVAMAMMWQHEFFCNDENPKEEWRLLSDEEREDYTALARAFLRALRSR